MTAAEFFEDHKGSHCAPPSSPAALFFRWLLRTAKRRSPAPASFPLAGAVTTLLTPPDGEPVLRDQMLSEVRAEQDALPRRTPGATLNGYGRESVARVLEAERLAREMLP